MSGSKGSEIQPSRTLQDLASLEAESARKFLTMRGATDQVKQRINRWHDRNYSSTQASEPSVSAETRSGFRRTFEDLDTKYAEEIGHGCDLCQKDLAYDPERLGSKFANPAETAVLPCGHVFHFKCLQLTVEDKQSPDPPCVLCISRHY